MHPSRFSETPDAGSAESGLNLTDPGEKGVLKKKGTGVFFQKRLPSPFLWLVISPAVDSFGTYGRGSSGGWRIVASTSSRSSGAAAVRVSMPPSVTTTVSSTRT